MQSQRSKSWFGVISLSGLLYIVFAAIAQVSHKNTTHFLSPRGAALADGGKPGPASFQTSARGAGSSVEGF